MTFPIKDIPPKLWKDFQSKIRKESAKADRPITIRERLLFLIKKDVEKK